MEKKSNEILKENSLKNQNYTLHNIHGNLDTEEKLSDSSHLKYGHWNKEEHEKFLEGITKYGNDWKLVQNHIGTRSLTQARSHGQKFFQRMKKKLNIGPESKNQSKEILYIFLEEYYHNRILTEKAKSNILKIIETFTELPIKKL